jgi:8-oxo-dGTP diphosphatase
MTRQVDTAQIKPLVKVAAGVLTSSDGRILIARRPEGGHLAGQWEFPGGKINPDESGLDGLVRELTEELGITVMQAEPLLDYYCEYPDRRVHLNVWRVTRYDGDPGGCEGQALRWVEPTEILNQEDFLSADRPIVEALLK